MVQDQIIVVSERAVYVTPFPGLGAGPKPAVLLLHGTQGFTREKVEYGRFASALASKGFDVYLVHYYSSADLTAVQTGQNLVPTRLVAWSKLVSEVGSAIGKSPQCTGKVAVVGFSAGGFVAIGAAASDPRFDAAVVFYGGMPKAISGDVNRLPPLLVVHGDADKAMPISVGQNLAARARQLGGVGELAVFPGEGHGFAIRRSEASTKAFDQTVTFLRQHLMN